MAHTKAQKTVSGNRDSAGRRLGIKLYGVEFAKPGNIILRQKGTQFHVGPGTMLSRDFTIIAMKEGKVKFYNKAGKRFVSVV
jgi:large subunit ribosomal protein L27